MQRIGDGRKLAARVSSQTGKKQNDVIGFSGRDIQVASLPASQYSPFSPFLVAGKAGFWTDTTVTTDTPDPEPF